jgi:hypothetical protein
MRLATAAALLLMTCGFAQADRCGDLVGRWKRLNEETHGHYRHFVDRNLSINSCESRAAECQARRKTLDGLRRMMAAVGPVYGACGPRYLSTYGLDRSAMQKVIQDEVRGSEADVARDCSKEQLTMGCTGSGAF